MKKVPALVLKKGLPMKSTARNQRKPATLVVVTGGSAPAINAAIAAFVMTMVRKGYIVYGAIQGFERILEKRGKAIIRLTPELVKQSIDSGAILVRTSRRGPRSITEQDELKNFLLKRNIRKMFLIGGDGTIALGHTLSHRWKGEISVACAAASIDNDVPITVGGVDEDNIGFDTACQCGSVVLGGLLNDVHNVGNRWGVVITMGKRSGALALGTVRYVSAAPRKSDQGLILAIPELFTGRSLESLVERIGRRIVSLRRTGTTSGVVVLAEGVAEVLNEIPDEFHHAERDTRGAVVDPHEFFAALVASRLRQWLAERGRHEITIKADAIGRDTRSQPPTMQDRMLASAIGRNAGDFLHHGGSSAVMTANGASIPFARSIFPLFGTARSRQVDPKGVQAKGVAKILLRP